MIQKEIINVRSKAAKIVMLTCMMLSAGCVTRAKLPTSDQNPPPVEAFSNFSDFELKPIDRGPACDKQHGADVALNGVENRMHVKLRQLIANWKAAPNAAVNVSSKKRTLIIEPICSNAKMMGKGSRMSVGLFGGDSVVILNVRYKDAESGKIIADPVFYQRTNVFSGAFSWGATDQDMLERMASMIAIYTSKNYESAVGGPTGLEIKN